MLVCLLKNCITLQSFVVLAVCLNQVSGIRHGSVMKRCGFHETCRTLFAWHLDRALCMCRRENGEKLLGIVATVSTRLGHIYRLFVWHARISRREWHLPRSTLLSGMLKDLEVLTEQEVFNLQTYYLDGKSRCIVRSKSCETLTAYRSPALYKFAKKLVIRQRVVATAAVYFRRFYVKYVFNERVVIEHWRLLTILVRHSNSLRETDPVLVVATSLYLASKVEECPLLARLLAAEFKDGYFGKEITIVALRLSKQTEIKTTDW